MSSPASVTIPPRIATARRILVSSSTLGVAIALERGLGFFANFLAARLGGAGMYGSYSLALTTANSIATYAGGGIGSTATRFSGEYSREAGGYGVVARALLWVSVVSAVLAVVILALAAGPLARLLLHNPDLTNLLRWSALSAGAIVLLECWRGFFVGQRQYAPLLTLSLVAGAGLLCGLPLAAGQSASTMVMTHASVAVLALVAAGMVARRQAPAQAASPTGGTAQLAGRVWRFGLMQLAGIAGLNVAGFWIASQVTLSDSSMVQMGLFAVANQFRNMAAMVPGLLTQSSYGMLAETADGSSPHESVMALCSLGASFSSTLLAGSAIVALPLILPALFGASFQAGVLPGVLALATAIIHMSSAPASARLTIVSLRASGIINALWAVTVVAVGTLLVPTGGALAATGIYLATHLMSLILVLWSLGRFERIPAGIVPLSVLLTATVGVFATLSFLREMHSQWALFYSAAIGIAMVLSLTAQTFLGQRHGWIPRKLRLDTLRMLLPGSRRQTVTQTT